MMTRASVSQLGSTGLLGPALWLPSSEPADPPAVQHSLPHLSFASAADVLREAENNPDVTQQ